MREHCARGYQMLRKIPFLQEAAEIVYSHQEHYDGSGKDSAKTEGRGDPLGARSPWPIRWATIASDRPYRASGDVLCRAAGDNGVTGAQFDLKVVEVYLSLPDQLWGRSAGGNYPASEKFLFLQLEPKDRIEAAQSLR